MEPRPIRVVHYGLGAIGSAIARLTAAQRGLEVVGGIDHDPAKIGHDLGDVIRLGRQLGTLVSNNATELLLQTHPDVVIHATTSLFHQVYSQILDCVAARAHVISTCEELVYPYTKQAAASNELHRLAVRSGVTVVGAGVNPGFVMDLLPLLLTAPCVDVKRISVARLMNATNRRAAVHQRIGAGLTLDQFRDHVAHGTVRHVGLSESMHMLADGMGWQLSRVTETIDPILADDWVQTSYEMIAPGQVAGIRQHARGWMHGREVLSLSWEQAVGERTTEDAIHIEGTPPIDLVIRGGLHGEQAAAALILHAIPRVLAAPPGLTTVLSLPPMHYQPRPEPEQLARVR